MIFWTLFFLIFKSLQNQTKKYITFKFNNDFRMEYALYSPEVFTGSTMIRNEKIPE